MRNTPRCSAAQHIVLQLAATESVNALTWIRGSAHVLAAGFSFRRIQIYDTRCGRGRAGAGARRLVVRVVGK